MTDTDQQSQPTIAARASLAEIDALISQRAMSPSGLRLLAAINLTRGFEALALAGRAAASVPATGTGEQAP